MAATSREEDLQRRLAEAEARAEAAERRTERALQTSEAKYRRLFETMGQAYDECEIIRDADGRAVDYRLIAVNQAFRRLTGLTAEEAEGRTAREVIPGLDDWWVEAFDDIVKTGEPRGIEREVADLSRWYRVNAYPQGGDRFVALVEDVTERKRAEIALRDAEERQAFLLQLADELRPLADPIAVQEATARLLGKKLKVDRCYYAEFDWPRDVLHIHHEYVRSAAVSAIGAHPISAFNDLLAHSHKGEPLVCDQMIAAHPVFGGEAAAYRERGTDGFILVPLVKQGTMVACMCVTMETPREWKSAEVALVVEVGERTWAAVERARAEAALRESEERQAFLLKLSDALRPLVDAEDIQRAAARLAGQHFNMANANYARIETRDGAPYAHVRQSYAAPGRQSMDGDYPLADFPGVIHRLQAGERMIVREIATDPNLTPTDKATYAAMDIANLLMVPLVKGGRPAAAFAVHGPAPKDWSEPDVRLLEEVAERTWASVERARAEAALRESDERFRQFAENSASGLWTRDARTLDMDYVSPAVRAMYGVAPQAFLGDIRQWAAHILPEDRETALRHIDRAREGEPTVDEFRIRRAGDQSFRWVRDAAFPLMGRDGRVERIGGIFEDVTEAKLADEHQGVLLAELQHRVRNIMGLIRSMALRTADGAADVADYRTALEGRLLALARVQALLTRQANAGGSLRDIVATEVGAQAPRSDQFQLDGPPIRLSPKAVEVLTLAFHELATNALKYGAFSTPQGRLRVSWAPFEKRGRAWLALDWTESGATPRATPTRRGFGSDLIEGRIPYELGGTGKLDVRPAGVHCRLEFPLKDGQSILETDAPKLSRLFGGTLDMTDAPDLTGRRVLVVEDDYYMAGDTAAALRGAGAEVLGPCPNEEMTFELLDAETPTHAVLDLNLGGGGPRFEVAHALRARGVPFVFLTGYDPGAIPADLAAVARLQKPVPFREIVEAVGRL